MDLRVYKIRLPHPCCATEPPAALNLYPNHYGIKIYDCPNARALRRRAKSMY